MLNNIESRCNDSFEKRLMIFFLFQAALCADYSVPVDCVNAGPAPRPSSFHETSAPKVCKPSNIYFNHVTT